MVEAEKTKSAEANLKPTPAGVHQAKQIQVSVRVRDYTELTGYPHWGLNE